MKLKHNKNLSILWIIVLSILVFIIYRSYQNNIIYQQNLFSLDVNQFQKSISNNLQQYEIQLIESANLFLKNKRFETKDFSISIFDKNKNIINASYPNFKLFPYLDVIDNLFLISDLTSTPIWLTVENADLSTPSVLYLYPVKNEKGIIDRYFLFTCSNIDSFFKNIFRDYEKFEIYDYVYIYKNGYQSTSIHSDRTFIVPNKLKKNTLKGEKNLFIQENFNDIQLFGGFYLPDLNIAILFEKKSELFLFLYFISFITICWLIFGLFYWFQKNQNIKLTFALVSFFVFIVFSFRIYQENIKNNNYYKSQFFFETKSLQILLNQYLAHFQSLLDKLNIFEFDFKLNESLIEPEIENFGALAAVFYQKNPDREVYKTIKLIGEENWKAPDVLIKPDQKNKTSFIGPFNDPVYGLVFFALKVNSDKTNATLIVFDASYITSELDKIWQNFKSPFILKDSENNSIYIYGEIDEPQNTQTFILPASGWKIEIQNPQIPLEIFKSTIFKQWLFSCLILTLVLLFYFTENKITVFGISYLTFAIFIAMFLLVSYIVFGSLMLKNDALSKIVSEINTLEELQNQVALLNSNYLFNKGKSLKNEKIILDVKIIENTDNSNINLKGMVQLDNKNITQLDIWNATPSYIDISKNSSRTPFDLTVMDNSNLIYFPLNPIVIRLPININSTEDMIFTVDEKNFKELQNLTFSGMKVFKSGARYVQKSNTEIPQLEYIFVFERSLTNSIIAFIVPLIISIGLLYQGFIVSSKNHISENFVVIWGTVLFTIVLLQNNYRSFVKDAPFTFLEYFFIASFIFINAVQALIIVPSILKKEKNLEFLTKFYFVGWLFILSLFIHTALTS
jgi:hypothetical protein